MHIGTSARTGALFLLASLGCNSGGSDVTEPEPIIHLGEPNPPTASFLSIASDSGDYVGQGLTIHYDTTNSQWQQFTFNPGSPGLRIPQVGVMVSAPSASGGEWDLAMSGLVTGPFVPGDYLFARRWPFQGLLHPGLMVFGNSRGCNSLSGSFTVLSITTVGPRLVQFHATFVQHCEGATPKLVGEVSIVPLTSVRASR